MLGVAADWCGACRVVRPFNVFRRYESWQAGSIPSGLGRPLDAFRSCRACGTSVPCEPNGYDELLAPDSVDPNMPVEALISRTHRNLSREMEERARLEDLARAEARGRTPADPDRPAALQLAIKRLDTFDPNDPEVENLRDAIECWTDLTEEERREAIEAVDTYEKVRMQYQSADGMVRQLSDESPGALSVVVFFTSFVVGCVAALSFVFDHPWQRTTALVTAAAVGSLAIYRRLDGLLFRQWFSSRLIPEAEKRNLDPVMLVGLLDGIGPLAEGVPRGMQQMAGHTDKLVYAYLRRGKLALGDADVASIDRFLRFMAPSAPTYTGCLVFSALWVVGAVPGLWWMPTWGVWAGLGIWLATVLVASQSYAWLKRMELRAWTAQTLLPAMDRHRIGVADLLRTLQSIPQDGESPASVRRLSQGHRIVADIFRARRRHRESS